eukprot:scaffold1936_cov201-Alexandrium_tamarense.AAC.3
MSRVVDVSEQPWHFLDGSVEHLTDEVVSDFPFPTLVMNSIADCNHLIRAGDGYKKSNTVRCAIWNVRRNTVGYFRDVPLELMHHGLWLIQQHYNDADTRFIMTGTNNLDEASTKAETLTRLFNMLRGWGVSQMFQSRSVAMRPQRKRGREDEN